MNKPNKENNDSREKFGFTFNGKGEEAKDEKAIAENDDFSIDPSFDEVNPESLVPSHHSDSEHHHHHHHSSHHNHHKKKKMRKWKKVLLIIGIVVTVIIAALGTTYLVLKLQGEQQTGIDKDKVTVEIPDDLKDDVDIADKGQYVYYKGDKYAINENVTTFLFMGVDRSEFTDDQNSQIGYNGQADAVFLLALNTDTGKADLVSVSRDTITDVDIYSATGDYMSTEKMQLCLAYAYGDGRETSCENVMRSVSRIMFGLPINSYAAIDMDALPVLTDAVGGVEVAEYEKDLLTPTGRTVHIDGKKAEGYLRIRTLSSVEANNARVERQKSFLKSFMSKAVSLTKSNPTTPITLYNTLTDYMVTDITASQITYLASDFLTSFDSIDHRTVPGKSELVDGHAAYYTDNEKLFEIILEIYYEKVEEQ